MSLSEHAAPGANAGFSFQFERALHWLSGSSAGSAVGIETDDDVAVRSTDGEVILEQDKHSIRENAKPFGNRSKDLWNTLAIWMDALDSEEVSAGKTLFLMVTNKVLPEGLVRKISEARKEAEIEDCIKGLELSAVSPPKDVEDIVRRVLRMESRPMLRSLIGRCRLIDGSQGASGDDLRLSTIGKLQLPSWSAGSSESILDELRGWMHKTALRCWQENRAAWIQRSSFVDQLHAILDRRRRFIIRERAEHLIPVPDDKMVGAKGSVFVKQLYLITDDDSIIDTSIREFVRCNIEKARLSAEGNVTDEDWIAFEAALFSRWGKIRSRIIRLKRESDERDVGFEVFTDTTESHCEKLAGSSTEQNYLTSGSYHRMAEVLKVGWHPKFNELIEEVLRS